MLNKAMFVHKSRDYVTGEGASGTVPLSCLRGGFGGSGHTYS